MGVYVPSGEELDSGKGDFALLPPDQYIVEVMGGEQSPVTKDQPNPYNRTEQFPGGVPRPVLNVQLKVISFADGQPLVDVDGNDPVNEPRFFAFLDTTKVGLKPQASAFRKFLAAAFSVPVDASINIDAWSELVGKRLIVTMEHSQKGQHKVKDYSPIRTRPARRGAAAPAEAAPATARATAAAAPAALNDEDLSAKAAEVFGEDVSF